MSDRNQLLAQIIANMGGGGGTTPDGTPVLNAAKEYTDEQLAEALVLVNQDIQANSTRYIGTFETLEDLENSVEARSVVSGSWGIVDPIGEPPTSYFWDTTEMVWSLTAPDLGVGNARRRKFAILPIAGQSNAQGFGELPYTLDKENNFNERVFQLGRYATGSTTGEFNVTEAAFNYGINHELMRPYADCNLQIIPAAPCLDHAQNLWTLQNGGLAGFGMNTAKHWLKYLPDEYDIIIVPCARGGSRINPSGAVSGTYDSVNKRASQNATFWGAIDAPLYLDFKNRVSHCLDLSPDTLLLPVLWAQGEFDAGQPVAHYAGFEAIYDDFFAHIRDNYADRCVDGDIDNFRWICLSSTKWMWNLNLETDYRQMLNSVGTQNNPLAYQRPAPYDNYVRIAREKHNSLDYPHIHYVRIDINPNGRFVQTNREKGNGVSSSNRQLHFSTYGNTVEIPSILESAVTTIGGFPFLPARALSPRFDRCSVTTIVDSNNHITLGGTSGFDIPPVNPVIYQDFSAATAITDTVALDESMIVTSQGTGLTLVADDDFGQVLQMAKGGWLNYSMTKSTGDYTRSVTFKIGADCLQSTSETCNLISSGSGVGSDADVGVLWLSLGSISYIPNYITANRNSIVRWNISHILSEPVNLKGWIHATVVYRHDLGTASLHINGHKVGLIDNLLGASSRGTLNLGAFGSNSNTVLHFGGQIASARVYNDALTDEQVAYIAYQDIHSKFM